MQENIYSIEHIFRLCNTIYKAKEDETKEMKKLIRQMDFGCPDVNYVIYSFLFDPELYTHV